MLVFEKCMKHFIANKLNSLDRHLITIVFLFIETQINNKVRLPYPLHECFNKVLDSKNILQKGKRSFIIIHPNFSDNYLTFYNF